MARAPARAIAFAARRALAHAASYTQVARFARCCAPPRGSSPPPVEARRAPSVLGRRNAPSALRCLPALECTGTAAVRRGRVRRSALRVAVRGGGQRSERVRAGRFQARAAAGDGPRTCAGDALIPTSSVGDSRLVPWPLGSAKRGCTSGHQGCWCALMMLRAHRGCFVRDAVVCARARRISRA